MKFFNLGLSEIIFIVIIALIIFGPENMVKTAKEAGKLVRKVTKSPYWKEVWATKRELNELPKMLAKEAELDETIRDLNKETQKMSSSVAASVSEFIKEVEEPIKKTDNELKKETAALAPTPENTAETAKERGTMENDAKVEAEKKAS